MLILYNVHKDMAGGVDFSAANAKSSAQLRVKGENDAEKCSYTGDTLDKIEDMCSRWDTYSLYK